LTSEGRQEANELATEVGQVLQQRLSSLDVLTVVKAVIA